MLAKPVLEIHRVQSPCAQQFNIQSIPFVLRLFRLREEILSCQQNTVSTGQDCQRTARKRSIIHSHHQEVAERRIRLPLQGVFRRSLPFGPADGADFASPYRAAVLGIQLEERPGEYDHGHREIDHESRHVNERCNKRGGGSCGIGPEGTENKRKHRA